MGARPHEPSARGLEVAPGRDFAEHGLFQARRVGVVVVVQVRRRADDERRPSRGDVRRRPGVGFDQRGGDASRSLGLAPVHVGRHRLDSGGERAEHADRRRLAPLRQHVLPLRSAGARRRPYDGDEREPEQRCDVLVVSPRPRDGVAQPEQISKRLRVVAARQQRRRADRRVNRFAPAQGFARQPPERADVRRPCELRARDAGDERVALPSD